MLLSIIVPVYNVENYLERCIESILNTTLSPIIFEILLINDGSTDNSAIICNKLATKYKNVHTYHKKNGGLSDARNFGIKKSKGMYIGFVDSDDFVSENAYTLLIENAIKHDADLVVGNAFKYINDDKIFLKFKSRSQSFIIQKGEKFLIDSIRNNTMSMSVVLAIYKKELIIDHNLFFKKGLLHEDELWTPITYLASNKVVYINHNFYYHYEREGSITQRIEKVQNSLDLLSICHELDSIYSNLVNKRSKKELKNYLCMLYLNAAFIGKINFNQHQIRFDKFFPIKRAWSTGNLIKSILFTVNTDYYYKLNTIVKNRLRKS